MTTIPFKKLHPNAVIPKIATTGAACVDVVATEVIYTPGKGEATVKLGFATAIPEGYKMCVAPRSSITNDYWFIQNSPAQIDADYRGEWILKFKALSSQTIQRRIYGKTQTSEIQQLYTSFPYKVGDRVAQAWLEKVEPVEFTLVDELDTTERGEGGFGSTRS